MKVTRCQELSPSQAETIVGLTAVSVFCSPGFAGLWRHVGGKAVNWVVEEAGELRAVLPGVEFGAGLWRRFQAMPDGCYGRVFYADTAPDRKRAVVSALSQGLKKAHYAKLYIYDYYDSFGSPGDFAEMNCTTTIVDISSPEWQPPHESVRRGINKAEREGIEVRAINWDRDAAAFVELMRRTERRHGRSVRYPEAFFRSLAELARHDERIKWLWCEHDGEPAASHIYIAEDGAVIYWQGYFDKKFSFLRPNHYMHYTTAKAAAAQGVKYFNLGASPETAEGLKAYKDRWGGSPYSYKCYWSKSLLGRLV
ncbi:MAG: GNAT family N-acetyltransferase [candidate division Zixibacteria bacterium]|nr:GNAT family N-acetyltransferase [candidate division Zixibacteria bacterium]